VTSPRVLVLHNRYRVHGGEERAVELHLAALERAGMDHALLEADSAATSAPAAAAALLRGGEDPARVAEAARDLGADVAHCHNMLPLLGPRALEAAREAGARVILHLHNFRLFCAIGVAFRDGAPCFRCRRGLTLPGLALNCRGSLPEAAVYAAALARDWPRVRAAVDRFVAPSDYAAGQLVRLGVPEGRVEPLSPGLPDAAFAEDSRAAEGSYVLVAGRLAIEKGFDVAVEACARARVPLKVVGEGPLAGRLRERGGAELLGRVARSELVPLIRGAAMVLAPSRGGESFGLAALEAMAQGAPVIASRTGALPEVVGEERCVPRGDPDALAGAVRALWDDPERRRREGEAGLTRARERFGEAAFVARLRDLYERTAAA
jgi:glycosyltransferase involved in cell wall biosynthesis